MSMPDLKVLPLYRLEKPFYADDQYIAEGMEIQWEGIPNESMQPLNDAAVAKLKEFYKNNGGGSTPPLGEVAAAAMAARPKEDRQITVVTVPPKPPALMGDMQPSGAKKVGAAAASTLKVVPPATQPKYVRPISATANPAEETFTPGSI